MVYFCTDFYQPYVLPFVEFTVFIVVVLYVVDSTINIIHTYINVTFVHFLLLFPAKAEPEKKAATPKTKAGKVTSKQDIYIF